MSSVEKALAHFENNKATYLDDLKTLVKIPSVSFPGYPAQTLVRSAEAVADLLRERGLQNVELLRIGDAHPYVYGDWLHAPGKPTVLLYAHHDVQPIGRREVWKSDPFVPEERDGRLFGRGAADDKAGIVVHTGSIAAFLDAGEPLPVNVKVIIEGEEECGSDHLGEFLTRYKDKMMADVMVLTDAGNFDTGYPALTTSLRGLVAVDVEVIAQKAPLHSGMWGGAVVDPAVALSKMLGSLIAADGRIAIPGMYDQVRPLTKKERAELRKLPLSEKEFRKQTGMRVQSPLMGGKGEILEKLWRLPSLTVNAIQASNRQGAANIVCDRAWARVGIRTVPDMDAKTVRRLLVDHLKKVAPWGVDVQVKGDALGSWWTTDIEHPAFEAASRALEKGYGHRTAFVGCGGSIPFVGPFAKALGGVPALLVGVEDPYTLAHSENESLHLGDFDKAIRSSILLYQELAGLPLRPAKTAKR